MASPAEGLYPLRGKRPGGTGWWRGFRQHVPAVCRLGQDGRFAGPCEVVTSLLQVGECASARDVDTANKAVVEKVPGVA